MYMSTGKGNYIPDGKGMKLERAKLARVKIKEERLFQMVFAN